MAKGPRNLKVRKGSVLTEIKNTSVIDFTDISDEEMNKMIDGTLTDFDERGVATARLSASTMEHFSDERMRATDASYHSLDPAKPQLALTGDRAWSNDSLETVELEGNVQLSRAPFKDEPDLFFTTEYIKGYLDTYRFETDRKVYMRRGIDTTEASNGMKYDNILHTVELDGSVVSVFHPNAQSTDTSANAAQK